MFRLVLLPCFDLCRCNCFHDHGRYLLKTALVFLVNLILAVRTMSHAQSVLKHAMGAKERKVNFGGP